MSKEKSSLKKNTGKHFRMRLACVFMAFSLVFCFCRIIANAAYSSGLADCSRILSDSNSTGAYLCGFSGSTLCTSEVLPYQKNFSVTAEKPIKSACIDLSCAYALYAISGRDSSYGILEMNINTGSTNTYSFSGVKQLFKNQFSISDGCAFFTRTDSVHSYVAVYDLSGDYETSYKFDDDVYSLFNNNGNTYAELFNGSIYQLSESECTYICSSSEEAELFNAGADVVCESGGELISLNKSQLISGTFAENLVACSNGFTYDYVDGKLRCRNSSGSVAYAQAPEEPQFLLAYDNTCACVGESCNYNLISNSEFKSENSGTSGSSNSNSNTNSNSGGSSNSTFGIPDGCKLVNEYLCVLSSGVNVSTVVNNAGSSAKMYDENGSAVTSGKVRSGYVLSCGSESYTVFVLGDITGEGNVKSNDTEQFMKYLAGEISLDALQLAAADYNFDNNVDARDLVLISRAVSS